MAKITPIVENQTGQVAAENINEAIQTVEIDATLTGDGNAASPLSVVNNGDVTGAASSIDDNITTFDGVTGKVIKDSGVNISAISNLQNDKADKDGDSLTNTIVNGVTLYNTGVATNYLDEQGNYTAPPSGGDVTGDTSSVLNHIANFADTSGKVIKDSGISTAAIVTLQTDKADRDGDALTNASINGVTPSDAGAGGTLYLDDKGNYTAPPSGGGGEINTASNVGTGEGLSVTKVGSDLPFKSLKAGTNITLTGSGTEVLIDAATGGSGEANTTSTSGSGAALTLTKIGSDLPFRGIKGIGANITTDADSLWVTAASATQGSTADSATQPGDNVSTLTNDSNFIDSAGAPVQTVNTKSGAVVLDAADVGAATAAQGALADTAIQPTVGLIQDQVGAPTYAAREYCVLTTAEYGALTPQTNTLYFIV